MHVYVSLQPELIHLFKKYGYDNTSFIATMTEADLQRIGIKERTQRNLFIRRINNLQQFSFAASIPVCYKFYFIVPQYMNITTKFSTLKLLFFSFSSGPQFLRLWTGNVNRFRGLLVPRPDWITVLYLFGTLGLHRQINISKF